MTMTTQALELNPAILELLPPDSRETCDGHASGGTAALFKVTLPLGHGVLMLCGHHSRAHGYDPRTYTTYLHEDNKAKGSDH